MKHLAIALLLAACGSPSGATCPPNSDLSYSGGSAGTDGDFGEEFFSAYCTSCHSATAPNRYGAPTDQNFDTVSEILLHADDIDEEAASGPSATNTDMPRLDGDVIAPPSLADRVKLGEFLACLKDDQ